MGTKRTPIGRPPRARISRQAIALFREMEAIVCTCLPRDWNEYWKHEECAGCKRWWELHSDLHDELELKPWQWPAYRNPADDTNWWPVGSPMWERWVPDEEGRAQWRLLEAASRELAEAEKAAP